MRDMVKTIEGQVEAFDAFLAHGDDQLPLQNVIVNCQVLEQMREAKRVCWAAVVHDGAGIRGSAGAAFELVGLVFQILGVGVGSTAPVDMLKDVTRLQEADSNVVDDVLQAKPGLRTREPQDVQMEMVLPGPTNVLRGSHVMDLRHDDEQSHRASLECQRRAIRA